jgi:hypothetical protein
MFIISFPRSGQHLIERLLKHIYNYYDKKCSYCEYYNCCNEIPCNKNCLFQKNHDFDLNLELKIDEKFLILYRKDKIYQIESFFRLTIFGAEVYNANVNYEDEKIFNNLINCIKEQSKYYDDFVNKYIKSNKYKQTLIVEYDDFLFNYKDYIKQIILFLNLTNSENIDLDIENIVNTFEKIEYKNSLDNEIYKKIHKILDLDI